MYVNIHVFFANILKSIWLLSKINSTYQQTRRIYIISLNDLSTPPHSMQRYLSRRYICKPLQLTMGVSGDLHAKSPNYPNGFMHTSLKCLHYQFSLSNMRVDWFNWWKILCMKHVLTFHHILNSISSLTLKKILRRPTYQETKKVMHAKPTANFIPHPGQGGLYPHTIGADRKVAHSRPAIHTVETGGSNSDPG